MIKCEILFKLLESKSNTSLIAENTESAFFLIFHKYCVQIILQYNNSNNYRWLFIVKAELEKEHSFLANELSFMKDRYHVMEEKMESMKGKYDNDNYTA